MSQSPSQEDAISPHFKDTRTEAQRCAVTCQGHAAPNTQASTHSNPALLTEGTSLCLGAATTCPPASAPDFHRATAPPQGPAGPWGQTRLQPPSEMMWGTALQVILYPCQTLWSQRGPSNRGGTGTAAHMDEGHKRFPLHGEAP